MPTHTRTHKFTVHLNATELSKLRRLAALDVEAESEQHYMRRLLRFLPEVPLQSSIYIAQPALGAAPVLVQSSISPAPSALSGAAPVLVQSSPAHTPGLANAAPEPVKVDWAAVEASWKAEASAKREP